MKLANRYIIRNFLSIFFLIIFIVTALFVVIDFFDRSKIFIKSGASLYSIFLYVLYKTPTVIPLMIPVAVLLSTLLSVGRLCLKSEITALRASGVSLYQVGIPLIGVGFLISILSFLFNEKVVSYCNERLEDIYHIQIKQKDLSGVLDRSDFWFRSENRFVRAALYDAGSKTILGFSFFEFREDNSLKRRIDSERVSWFEVGKSWVMSTVTETVFNLDSGIRINKYAELPLVIDQRPEGLRNLEKDPESFSAKELRVYIDKLAKEGISTQGYLVDLANKYSFPFVNVLVVIVALPLAVGSSRAPLLTRNGALAVAIGFLYFVIHAFFIALGKAELVPVFISAWGANILLFCLGGFLFTKVAERF